MCDEIDICISIQEHILRYNITETAPSYVATRPPLPLILSRQIERPNPYVRPKQAWLESIDTLEGEKLGIIDLHPDIFGAQPRYCIYFAISRGFPS